MFADLICVENAYLQVWRCMERSCHQVSSKQVSRRAKTTHEASEDPQKAISSVKYRTPNQKNQTNPNLVATSPRQSGQKACNRPPKKAPKAPPATPKRFTSTGKKNVENGEPGKLDFQRMYHTESRFLEVLRRSHDPAKQNKNRL